MAPVTTVSGNNPVPPVSGPKFLVVWPDRESAPDWAPPRDSFERVGGTRPVAPEGTHPLPPDRVFADLCQLVGAEGRQLTIAVMDSGFAVSHPQLAARLWTNPGEIPNNGIDDDGNGLIDDVHGYDYVDEVGRLRSREPGHGSHVMGLATAGTKQIKAIGLRIFNPMQPRFIGDAIDYAVANGARVINMSHKVDSPEEVEIAKAAMARHPDVLFVKSAGNNGSELPPDHSGRFHPGTYLPTNNLPNMLVVAAADPTLVRRRSSNYGGATVDVAAIGGSVRSVGANGDWAIKSGTSMAAPKVANLASKCRILNPELSPDQLKRIVTVTCNPFPAWRGLVISNGMINPERAMRLACLMRLRDQGVATNDALARIGVSGAEAERLAQWLAE
jgi:subtilisin family serine protease